MKKTIALTIAGLVAFNDVMAANPKFVPSQHQGLAKGKLSLQANGTESNSTYYDDTQNINDGDYDLYEDSHNDTVPVVQVDKSIIERFLKDAEDFVHSSSAPKIPKTAFGIVKSIDDAYKNTAAKFVLNYAKTYGPLLESEGKYITEAWATDANCDEDCAV